MSNTTSDIIIPVYNAYDDLVECVESVFKNTSDDEYRLILINDKSTDAKINIYLDKLKKMKRKNLIILSNEENLGFVKTVNKGMKYSNHDVVLLNSDTIVTENWLRKLKKAAYIDKTIATVTPLTNNGTICSVPNFCQDNEIPKDFTLDQYAKMIEEISFKKYPIIPTAVGFCMYIKRIVINEIGFFDEDNFGKGYGEENDFCCRAIEHGYINVLSDDTFIYHKGSMSFKDDKNKYIRNNLKVLENKYSYYFPNVNNFINRNPLKEIQENIKLHIKLNNGKRNILYILHNDFLKGINHPVGGTEFHVKDLVESINDLNKYVMVVTDNEIILSAFINDDTLRFNYTLEEQITDTTFYSYRYSKILEQILKAFNIDVIHIQHFKKNTLDIPKIAKKFNLPVTVTLHDFYAICPTINLLDANGVYCKDTRNEEMCKVCIKKKLGFDTDFLKTWNENVKKFLSECDVIFTPSESAKKIIEDYYGNLNIKVIEHGVRECHIEKKSPDKENKFKIAFIGGLAPYKGSGIIHSLITNNKQKDIEWYLLGNLGDQRLNLLQRSDLVKYGRYNREDICNILINLEIDLVCNLAIWPETYSYTLTEAWQAQIPVLATDVGAIGDRIRTTNGGWLVALNTKEQDILEKIYSIKSDSKEYNEKLKCVTNIKFPSKDSMSKIYTKEYESLIIKLPRLDNGPLVDSNSIYKAYKLGSILDGENDEISIEVANKIRDLESEIKIMRNTLGWKLMNKMRSKYPNLIRIFKKGVYLILPKYYKKG
ncbi:Glycosyltransferase, GT2 family [Natronincola peptidivorans]|uniref:Glycosyltransferase, GT2 family n=1 Tax=Natronincola peptidivorans TaxID=426128 RepID=A0A1I0CPW2_9FIRM|nr:glycosyltransferase [Natronincola peptidivorans]SET21786.1 Glycosyltransferase, GT2 family [Natronincola peptidivorans]